MKLVLFDRKKYNQAISLLEQRKAPKYVIEAYKAGYYSVVSDYTRTKLESKIAKTPKEKLLIESISKDKVEKLELDFLTEAYLKNDIDFMKSFFAMTNLDIFSGKRLPPSAGAMLRQDITKDLGLKDLFKKLR